ncbi:hypothetical protein ACN6LA_001994 [Streptomyces sp. SAS_269]|uniref:MmyB family transcriptional regulator n=1 Tax=Streptomyces sp. SAS_269 TaxID=3412749 RepID=UPI00403D5403
MRRRVRHLGQHRPVRHVHRPARSRAKPDLALVHLRALAFRAALGIAAGGGGDQPVVRGRPETILAQRGHDPAAATLVADLRAASAEFAGMWDRHRVSTLHCSTKSVFNRQVGRLDLDCVVLASPLSRQRLLLLRPVPGTPTTDRLNRLRRLIEEVSRRGGPAVSA